MVEDDYNLWDNPSSFGQGNGPLKQRFWKKQMLDSLCLSLACKGEEVC